MTERVWTKWSDQRPPNKPGEYRFRVVDIEVLGMTVTPEWTEKLSLCGMGYADSEWWPVSPCHWDGYRRYMTADIEWSEVREGDPEGVTWNGVELLPCPFTGKMPTIGYCGRYIGAPPYRPDWLHIKSHLVDKTGFSSFKALISAWNTRPATS